MVETSQMPQNQVLCNNCSSEIVAVAVTPKRWYKSMGMIAAIAGVVVSLILVAFGVIRYFDFSKHLLDNITTLSNSASAAFTAMGSAVTAGLALYAAIGRARATQPIGDPANPVVVPINQ